MHLISFRVTTRREPPLVKAQAPGTPDLPARVWWWYHVYVVYRIPLSKGTPRAASMRAASAAAAKASGASEAPFCEACRNMEKHGKQNGEARLRVPPYLGEEGARA